MNKFPSPKTNDPIGHMRTIIRASYVAVTGVGNRGRAVLAVSNALAAVDVRTIVALVQSPDSSVSDIIPPADSIRRFRPIQSSNGSSAVLDRAIIV